jgi:hypothetical protein
MISREVTGFVIHQVSSTLGVMVLSAISCYEFVELLKLVRINVATQAVTFVLLGVPGFPFQGAVGFFLGFGLARYIWTKSVVFVWTIPFLLFCIGAFTVAPSSSPLTFLVGGGCRATRGCFYQISFTLPLIASVFYTLGAISSRSIHHRSDAGRHSTSKS